MIKLKQAVDILSTYEAFKNVSVIGELNWKTIPEAYIVDKVYIDNDNRIEIRRQDSTTIVNISNVGLFQLI